MIISRVYSETIRPESILHSSPREAVAAGKIEKTRYESYLRLYEQASSHKEWEMK